MACLLCTPGKMVASWPSQQTSERLSPLPSFPPSLRTLVEVEVSLHPLPVLLDDGGLGVGVVVNFSGLGREREREGAKWCAG